MASPLHPSVLAMLEELNISNMWQKGTFVEVLENKGVLTKVSLREIYRRSGGTAP